MRLLVGLLLASCAFGQSHEILRPTVDVNSTMTSTGCVGVNQSSSSMPNSYDAAGLATSSTQTARGNASQGFFKVRKFTTWASPTQSYTALSLKVNSSETETNNTGSGGYANVSYSLNGGTTWATLIDGIGWLQTTFSVSLGTGQDFTKIQVAVCVESDAGGDTLGAIETLKVWDIWTDGIYTAGVSGNGSGQGVPAIQPILISEVLWRRNGIPENNV